MEKKLEENILNDNVSISIGILTHLFFQNIIH